MSTKTIEAYQVNAARQVCALRGGQGSRTRGGVTFAAAPVIVALVAAAGVDHVVTASELEAIISDTQLRHRRIELEAPAVEGDKPKARTTSKPTAGGAGKVPKAVAQQAAAEKKVKVGRAKAKAEAEAAAAGALEAERKAAEEAAAKAEAEADAKAKAESEKGKG